jgi:hypothetical protein
LIDALARFLFERVITDTDVWLREPIRTSRDTGVSKKFGLPSLIKSVVLKSEGSRLLIKTKVLIREGSCLLIKRGVLIREGSCLLIKTGVLIREGSPCLLGGCLLEGDITRQLGCVRRGGRGEVESGNRREGVIGVRSLGCLRDTWKGVLCAERVTRSELAHERDTGACRGEQRVSCAGAPQMEGEDEARSAREERHELEARPLFG